MIFSSKTIMADVIHDNHLLLHVINRFGIQLGFANKTIEQICNEKNINVDFFLEIINSYNDPYYQPESSLEKFSLRMIIDYLGKTHRYFKDIKIPDIAMHIDKLIETSREENKDNLLLIKNFFDDYVAELSNHFEYEDKTVYPYCAAIENQYQQKPSTIREQSEFKIIKQYSNEHLNVDEKLLDLKNIIIKYLPATKNYNLCNTILIDLFNLDNELKKHEDIENRVMIPRVLKIEEILSQNKN